MAFTDNDLAKLKEHMKKPTHGFAWRSERGLALIRRLDAAELFISVGSAHPMSKKYYEAWRKSKGTPSDGEKA